jgi:DNA polymerase-3 subunit chi
VADCQVDFYILKTAELDGHRLACRLALMAWERGYPAQVLTADEQAARSMDELLWRSPANRFVPHGMTGTSEAAAAPIRISTPDQLTDGRLLINLTRQPVSEPTRFERLLEIVPHEPADRDASREKFRFYRKHGLEPKTHDIAR